MPLPSDRRKRLIINATESEFSGYEFDGKVSDIITQMQNLIDTYGPNVTVDWDPNHWEPYSDSPSPRFWVKNIRPETDEEMGKRIVAEETQYRDFEAREREQYEKLKSKFGDK